jgi:hypothetical protein
LRDSPPFFWDDTKKALIFNSDPINLACFLAKQARLSILHKAHAEQAVTVKNNGIGFGKKMEWGHPPTMDITTAISRPRSSSMDWRRASITLLRHTLLFLTSEFFIFGNFIALPFSFQLFA